MEKSTILKLKSKFFIHRALVYAFFLLIPYWSKKMVDAPISVQIVLIFLYILFMAGQWFLLGKEIDHRLKIYYRVNSSMDRIVYRLLLGNIFFMVLFQLIYLLPQSVTKSVFWGIWIALGLFYSWPTRGKIIQEGISNQLLEFKFLDAFERTILFLILILFIVTLPRFTSLDHLESLKLYFDPAAHFSSQLWKFLSVLYFPFFKYTKLVKIAWSIHFYLVGMGLFLLAFYGILRFFISRRLSLLGIFALLSSWTFSKLMDQNIGAAFSSTYSLLWVWGLLWVTKSSTYRSGLFLGLLSYYGTILNQSYLYLIPFQFLILYLFSFKEKTTWYIRQFAKYFSFGLILSCLTYLFKESPLVINQHSYQTFSWQYLLELTDKILAGKAFYSLSIFGMIFLLLFLSQLKLNFLRPLNIDRRRINELLIIISFLFSFAFLFTSHLIQELSLMWMLTFLSLVPLEWIFQSMSRMRSRRNLVYLVYILICLLDSHFEGRIKTLIKILGP